MVQPEIIIQDLTDDLFISNKVTVKLARLDLMHAHYGGNKWFKLKYNLAEARINNLQKILTFGGAYSNHIYATAAACFDAGFDCVGVIRGEESFPLNDTLQFALSKNMKLHYVSRSDYKMKNEIDFINKLKNIYGDFYLIPEGGNKAEGIKGAMEIVPSINTDFDFIVCACGTFTTLAGIALSLNLNQAVYGISVLNASGIGLKSLNDFESMVQENFNLSLKEKNDSINIFEDYHFGGYAKSTTELNEFIDSFYNRHQIKLDRVYTAKMMFALYDLIWKKYFKSGTQIIVVMSGRPVMQ